jgi:hypothetical protein
MDWVKVLHRRSCDRRLRVLGTDGTAVSWDLRRCPSWVSYRFLDVGFDARTAVRTPDTKSPKAGMLVFVTNRTVDDELHAHSNRGAIFTVDSLSTSGSLQEKSDRTLEE